MKQLPSVPIQTDYVRFTGGIDQKTPVLSLKPGNALDAMNYEADVFGGYRRIGGFESFTGKDKPSDATYTFIKAAFNFGPSVGDIITGSTSGATGVVAYLDLGLNTYDFEWMALTKVVGTFVNGEAFTGGGGGTILETPSVRGAPSALDDARALNAAADIVRLDLGLPPLGSGPVLGVWLYKGDAYAFRNNAGGTAAEMWKATTSGWTTVDLGRNLAFTSGGVTEIVVGNTITGATSGATAVITHVDLTSGSWAGGTAAGTFYFTTQTGTFQAENLNVGASLNLATIAGNSSANTLLPDGRFEFVNYNFTGSLDTLKMYACDGVNRAFQFDGTNYVPIRTGMTTDAPKFIAAYKKMLFLGFRGSLQNSGIGNPHSWTVVTGSAEIAAGDEITELLAGTQSLFVFLRNATHYLTGSSVSDFVLNPLALDMGAAPYTAQLIGNPFALDDRGIVPFVPAQEYGNFNFDTISRQVQDLVDEIRGSATASVAVRSRNQYWIFAPGLDEDNQPYTRGLITTINGKKIIGITRFRFPVAMSCICSGEGADGEEVILFGASNGVVYEMNKGSSFDGSEIEAYIRMPFNNLRMPRHEKRFRKLQLEMTCESYSAIRFHPEFDYSSPDRAQHRVTTEAVIGAGGYWDASLWNEFFWDAQIVASPEFSIEGTGINMGMIFYSKSDIDLGHTLQGALIHYTPRKVRK